MIYRAIVAMKLRRAFGALNRGDHAPVLAAFGQPLAHSFFGRHALAGTRHDMPSVRAWYARLKKVFPDLRFEIDVIAVHGMPWNTVALVEWRDSFTLPDGTRAANQGVHALRMRWGRVVGLRVYCDTQLLASILDEIARQGVAEAGLPPIGESAGVSGPFVPQPG